MRNSEWIPFNEIWDHWNRPFSINENWMRVLCRRPRSIRVFFSEELPVKFDFITGERKGAFDRMLLNGSFLLITVASAVICGVPLLSHFAQIIVEWWSQYAR